MHILKGTQQGKTLYYTGRAGEAWVSENRDEAFPFYSKYPAKERAARFNTFTQTHGVTFIVEKKEGA